MGPYRLHCEPQAGCRKHRGETAQFGIAGLRQHLVGSLARELGPARDYGDAALRPRHLAKGKHDRGLIAFLNDGFDVGGGLSRILQPFKQPVCVGKARCGDATFASHGLCSLRNSLWHV